MECLTGVPAVVLAGGKAKPEMIAAAGIENRALIPFNGRTMLGHIVSALQDAPGVGRIVVVGSVPESPEYTRVDDQGGFVENIFAGLAIVGDAEYALITTSDLPFVSGEAVEDFVTRGRALGVDIVYPVVEVDDCYRRFPGIRRTAVAFREGRFTGGNMMLVRPRSMMAHRDRIAQSYAARKSPLRLAWMLGPGIVLRGAIALSPLPSPLTLPAVEKAVGRLLGGTARALLSRYPEIATDIDRPDDLSAIRAGERSR
jgi:GTP:adenosylcobinamide-phosphate guanylyltransferase